MSIERSDKFAAKIMCKDQPDFLALVQREVDVIRGNKLYRVWYTDPTSQRWCQWVSEDASRITKLEFVDNDIVQICWENKHIETLEVAVSQYHKLNEEKKKQSDWSFPVIECNNWQRCWAVWPVKHCDVERLNQLPLNLKEYFKRQVKWSDFETLRAGLGEDDKLMANLVRAHLKSKEDIMLLVVISTVGRNAKSVFSLLGWEIMELVFKLV